MSGTRAPGPDGYLHSAVLADGPRLSMKQVEAWLRGQADAQRMSVRRVPLAAMEDWHFGGTPLGFAHRSGKFFAVEGLRIDTDFGPVRQWDQPIINQPEIGILGIITRVLGGVRHFLMQAKLEPGNVNGVQLSPTVQATRSNYTRVHGGAVPPYLEYFTNPRARVIVDQLQGEQGSRYLRKQNRNMIVDVDEDVPEHDRFCWMTLGQVKQLLKQPNIVNMDTRTVLACLPLLDRSALSSDRIELDASTLLVGDLALSPFARDLLASVLHHGRPAHRLYELLHWLTDLRATYAMRLERRPIDQLEGWEIDDDGIHDTARRYFSVIGVEVETGVREVSRWQQPLVAHTGYGLNGFVLQRINGTLHFLVRACMYPGNVALFELASTVSRSNASEWFGSPDAPIYLDVFRDPPPAWVRYDAIQSEEGGRFYQYQNRYVILELPEGMAIPPSSAHRWMTLGQVQELLTHGYFNIEGRNLLACLDLCDGGRG